MRASCEGRPDGPESGPGPGRPARRAAFGAAAAALPSAAFAADAGVGPDVHLSIVLGGFAFVGALIFVFMRMRHSRRGGDSGVVGAIDHIIDGDGSGDGGGDGSGDGGGGD